MRISLEEMEHRPPGLCSLQGRQECLPYLRQEYLSLPECLSLPKAVMPAPLAISELSGKLGRRTFMKLRGEASEEGIGIFYETKPTSLLESTKVLRERV